ncbi:MAG: DUF1614 domain-containing protein [Candidatus Carbobacillus sp.]|nr:DUF1614 domain-containing protein [Candidatus Carbobacillus sp.]
MPLIWLFLLVLLIPMLFLFLFVQITTLSFTALGLTPLGATLLFTISIIGSMINIPLSIRDIEQGPLRRRNESLFPYFIYYYPPQVERQIIAINVGGALVPIAFSIYLLMRTPFFPALIATLVMTIVAKLLARPVEGVGIALPAFIPPLIAALIAVIVSPDHAAPVAYISGVLGTLIGADLLNLPRLKRFQTQMISIGGAGVFDGIFMISLTAAILALIFG